MFHHDGPFDACAPSRNRHKAKAPMLAWTSGPEDEAPASAAQLRADRRVAGLDAYGGMGGMNDSPYPNVAFPADDYSVKNSKQVDRIAEAWGIHEPEPYEEFFGAAAPRGNGDTASGASSARGSLDGYGATQNARTRTREHYRDRHDEARSQPARKNHRNLPPPQPLNLPGTNAVRPETADMYASGSPPSPGFAAAGQPKRSKSLMQKFRKMRDMPNVPIGAPDGEEDVSPPSSLENYSNGANGSGAENARTGRPSHRHNNSFFGKKIGRNTSAQGGPITPTREASTEQYVYVEKSSQKALPPRPQETPASPGYDKEDYFNAPGSPGSPITPGGTGMGRKASLLRKMKGVLGAANK